MGSKRYASRNAQRAAAATLAGGMDLCSGLKLNSRRCASVDWGTDRTSKGFVLLFTFQNIIHKMRTATHFSCTGFDNQLASAQTLHESRQQSNSRKLPFSNPGAIQPDAQAPAHLLPQMAQVLGVSVDVILGLSEQRSPKPIATNRFVDSSVNLSQFAVEF
ncbi:hypothetical protein [Rhodoferax lacus]|uniref:hypothetical protein n=1 Tax=Rhodoferax lacus TaxID=2184758 RepID=UPI00131428F7|nr:hypothetical protein [Rhodoferax lacus]